MISLSSESGFKQYIPKGKTWLLILLIVGFRAQSYAQRNRLSASLTPGLMYYQGDLAGSPLPGKGVIHFCAGLDIAYELGRIFKVSLGYCRGSVSGADSLVSGHEKRNLHFVSPINDFRVLTYINLNAIRRKIWPKKLVGGRDWKPSFIPPQLITGIGYVNFDPKGKFEGNWHRLQRLGTEGQNLGNGYPEPYGLWQFSIKYGMAMGCEISRQFSVEIQAVYSQLFTDYLDDVSGTYPDYKKLIAEENGEAAAFFTYGGRDGSKIREGNARGNPEKRDGYIVIGLKITYTLNRSEMQRIMNL